MMTILPFWPEPQGRLAEAGPSMILSRLLYAWLSPATGGGAPISGWRMTLQNPEPAPWVGSMEGNNAPGAFPPGSLGRFGFLCKTLCCSTQLDIPQAISWTPLCLLRYSRDEQVSSENAPQKGCLECLWPQIPLHMEVMKIGLVAPTERRLGEHASSA